MTSFVLAQGTHQTGCTIAEFSGAEYSTVKPAGAADITTCITDAVHVPSGQQHIHTRTLILLFFVPETLKKLLYTFQTFQALCQNLSQTPASCHGGMLGHGTLLKHRARMRPHGNVEVCTNLEPGGRCKSSVCTSLVDLVPKPLGQYEGLLKPHQ